MDIDQAFDSIGDEVEYRAFAGARTETGTITDVTDGAVLICFLGCTYSRRVHPRDLSRAAHPAGTTDLPKPGSALTPPRISLT